MNKLIKYKLRHITSQIYVDVVCEMELGTPYSGPTSIGLLLYYSLCTVSAQNFYGQGIRDAFSEFDLLGAISIPPDDGVKFVDGMDDFPAFFIKSDADIKSPHRMVLPEKLYEFAIMTVIKPESRTGGYIFSVVNPLDTVVQLGMHISPVIKDKWNLTLYYTDSSVHSTSQKLISYEMAYAKKWTKMALRVLSNKITIFLNCIEVETFTVKREPIELIFDSASTLYLAQTGPILKGNFERFMEQTSNDEQIELFSNFYVMYNKKDN